MNKVVWCVITLAVIVFAQVPKFSDNGLIKKNDGTPIKYLIACPWAGDWDGDGKKDLLLGVFDGGMVLLYTNSGTNNAPVFTTGSPLEAGGSQIVLSSG